MNLIFISILVLIAGCQSSKVVKQAAKPNHPRYIEMITEAIDKLNDRTGSSRQAILKYIVKNFKVQENIDSLVKMELKIAVMKGSLKQVKGVGASGSFKLNHKKIQKNPAKKPAAKKPAKKHAKRHPKRLAKRPAKKLIL